MKRREFITLLSCMTIWPLAAQAQQSPKIWRLGYVGTGALGDQLFEAFTQKLDALGYVTGKSILVNRSIVAPETKTIEVAITKVLPEIDILVIWGTVGGAVESALAKASPPCFCRSALPSTLG
jgi:putative ABC transport system substrate-binding protein